MNCCFNFVLVIFFKVCIWCLLTPKQNKGKIEPVKQNNFQRQREVLQPRLSLPFAPPSIYSVDLDLVTARGPVSALVEAAVVVSTFQPLRRNRLQHLPDHDSVKKLMQRMASHWRLAIDRGACRRMRSAMQRAGARRMPWSFVTNADANGGWRRNGWPEGGGPAGGRG